MRIPTVLLTGATALALAIGVANAKQPPKGSIYQWTEVADEIDASLDLNAGQAIATFYDGTFDTIKKCNADIASKIDSSIPPPCPINGSFDSCSVTGTFTFYRCLQGVFGTAR